MSTQDRYVVVYRCSSDISASEVFDNYEDALDFVESEDGAGDEKAVIIRAHSDCGVETVQLLVEYHT